MRKLQALMFLIAFCLLGVATLTSSGCHDLGSISRVQDALESGFGGDGDDDGDDIVDVLGELNPCVGLCSDLCAEGACDSNDCDGDGVLNEDETGDPDCDGIDGICDADMDPDPHECFMLCGECLTANEDDCDDDGIDDSQDFCPCLPYPGGIVISPANHDGDAFPDFSDNCPCVPNDAAGNVDDDNDYMGVACDNCPDVWNSRQTDTDGDGIGDSCECTGDEWTICQGLWFTYAEEHELLCLNLQDFCQNYAMIPEPESYYFGECDHSAIVPFSVCHNGVDGFSTSQGAVVSLCDHIVQEGWDYNLIEVGNCPCTFCEATCGPGTYGLCEDCDMDGTENASDECPCGGRQFCHYPNAGVPEDVCQTWTQICTDHDQDVAGHENDYAGTCDGSDDTIILCIDGIQGYVSESQYDNLCDSIEQSTIPGLTYDDIAEGTCPTP